MDYGVVCLGFKGEVDAASMQAELSDKIQLITQFSLLR